MAAVRTLLDVDGADPSAPGPDDPTRPPAYLAAKEDKPAVLKMLLEHAADPNQAKTDNRVTPLAAAAALGRAGVVEMLLMHNADPNQAAGDGETPLHVSNNLEVVKMLLEHRADPNLMTTATGCTPLYAAATAGDPEVVKALIAHNADPSMAFIDDGQTPVSVQQYIIRRRLSNPTVFPLFFSFSFFPPIFPVRLSVLPWLAGGVNNADVRNAVASRVEQGTLPSRKVTQRF